MSRVLRQSLQTLTTCKARGFLCRIKYEHNGSSATGYVIVDKADGMYPLVLYSGTRGRLDAYEKALGNVSALYESHVHPLLKDRTVKDWDQGFQEKVSEIPWNYTKEKEAVSAMGA